MFQFLKYLLLTLALFALLNLFRSNTEVGLALHFEVPLIGTYLTPQVPIFYLLILSFCFGGLFFTILGAVRIEDVYKQKKEIKKLKAETQKLVDEQNLMSSNKSSDFRQM